MVQFARAAYAVSAVGTARRAVLANASLWKAERFHFSQLSLEDADGAASLPRNVPDTLF